MRILPILCWALLVPGLLAQDLETVDDFEKFYKSYKETPERVEAVLALEGVDHPRVIEALVKVLPKAEPKVVEAMVKVLSGFEDTATVESLLATLAKQKKEPIRLALLRSIAAGGYTPLGEGVTDCLEDKSWPVRRAATLALAATGDATHVEAIVPLCEDKEVAVRCAALDGLTILRADEVRAPAMASLVDDAWQVRASAIAALGTVRHKDSIAPLIERLQAEDGRLILDVARALEEITGRNFGLRVELWTRFWDSYKDRYEIPTDEELAALREKQAQRKEEYEGAQSGLAYHGVETPSKRVLFVVDISGSMEDEMVEKERFKDGGYPSYSRMDIVKTELARTIEALEPHVEFNIAAFATEVKPWKKRLQKANVLGKTSAMDFVKRLEPIGGTSKETLHQAGLVGSANLEGGRTNTWAALAWALGIEADLSRPRDDAYELEIDTVFFLSDGKPTAGEFINTEEIVREVKKANELRKVVINMIALGPFQKSFMERMARDSGGVFVDLGK